ncbi:MAG: AMP-binding protein [bacterium]
MKTYRMLGRVAKGVGASMRDEWRRGTLGETLRLSLQKRTLRFAKDLSHADLLEEKAALYGDRPFLIFQGRTFSYRQMNERADRAAAFLAALGGGPGKHLALMMKNSPEWLFVFFGAQKIGMAAVPVNTALRGNQLQFVLNHSDACILVINHDLFPHYERVKDDIESELAVVINPEGEEEEVPEGTRSLSEAFDPEATFPWQSLTARAGDICLLMYTSGTTGLPKGVVTRYGNTNIKILGIVGRLNLDSDDVYYTCFPLFHANALLLTVTAAMHAGARVALSTRFSASKFWDEIYETGATVFNGLGAMIPILMKQPVKEVEKKNRVRYVLSAACPADMWEPFEKRFNLEIIEGYGAVDGGGLIIMNWGQAPKGSLGKPLGSKVRVVDDDMNDVPVREPGELVSWVGNRESSVEYYKNEKAGSEKVRDGWLHTGDLVYQDEKGYLYYVGRKSEFLRRRGENVSAYEVEHAILQHPDVLECAVYAVPSELAEDDIMAAVVPAEGKTVHAARLKEFLQDHLAKFAIPRYYRVMDELPKTETHRVIKNVLEKEGVTEDTIDLASS